MKLLWDVNNKNHNSNHSSKIQFNKQAKKYQIQQNIDSMTNQKSRGSILQISKQRESTIWNLTRTQIDNIIAYQALSNTISFQCTVHTTKKIVVWVNFRPRCPIGV